MIYVTKEKIGHRTEHTWAMGICPSSGVSPSTFFPFPLVSKYRKPISIFLGHTKAWVEVALIYTPLFAFSFLLLTLTCSSWCVCVCVDNWLMLNLVCLRCMHIIYVREWGSHGHLLSPIHTYIHTHTPTITYILHVNSGSMFYTLLLLIQNTVNNLAA